MIFLRSNHGRNSKIKFFQKKNIFVCVNYPSLVKVWVVSCRKTNFRSNPTGYILLLDCVCSNELSREISESHKDNGDTTLWKPQFFVGTQKLLVPLLWFFPGLYNFRLSYRARTSYNALTDLPEPFSPSLHSAILCTGYLFISQLSGNK